MHEFSSFWTFTYDDEHLPPHGSLCPRHVQLFLKRFRQRQGPDRLCRYFFVGEYGDETFRPHYHAALFGVSEMEVPAVQDAWGLGHVVGGFLSWQSAAYVAGYVTKKMTSPDDPRLKGRYPEFARMSLRPGIGAVAVPGLAVEMWDRDGAALIARECDVPASLMHGRKAMPLGRYLRRKLRAISGFETSGQPEAAAIRQVEELRALCAAAGGVAQYFENKRSIEGVKMDQVEGRARIWSKKGPL